MLIPDYGPGEYADPDAKPQRWGGPRAQKYVARVLAEKGGICGICGLPGSDSADHIITRKDGGAVYSMVNLRPAHRRCNFARGAKAARPVGIPIENGMSHFT